MRRKSERNKARSPEKKPEKSSRRTRRRRGSPESDEEHGSDNETLQNVKTQPEVVSKNPSTDSKDSVSNSDGESKGQSVWQVKSADAPADSGEIQKLKICLQRPSSSERSPRKHHGSSQESADSSEDIRKKRSKKHSHSKGECSDNKVEKQADQTVDPDANNSEPKESAVVKDEVTENIKVEEISNNKEGDNNDISNKDEVKNEEVTVELKTELKDEASEEPQTVEDKPVIKVEEAIHVQEGTKNDETIKDETKTTEANETLESCSKDPEVTEIKSEIQENSEVDKLSENSLSKSSPQTTSNDPDSIQENLVPGAVKPEIYEEKPIIEDVVPQATQENATAQVIESEHVQENVTSQDDKPELVQENNVTQHIEPGEIVEHSNTITNNKVSASENKEIMQQTESSSSLNDSEKVTRKRKWGSKNSATSEKKSAIAISTDSLKNLISDVKPLPLNEVLLEEKNQKIAVEETRKNRTDSKSVEKRPRTNSKSEERREKLLEDKLDMTAMDYEADDPPSDKESEHGEREDKKRSRSRKSESDRNEKSDSDRNQVRSRRRISINENVPEKKAKQNSTQKPSEILYITNLVRPFTVLQLKGLLARTGKLIENGFWIDNIKSRCFVRYENEDQAVETRHALHGTRWPASNPKLLQVEFSTSEEMEKCLSSLPPPPPSDNIRRTIDSDKVAMAWLTEQNFKDERTRDRDALRDRKQAVREWDLGKHDLDSTDNSEKFSRDVPVEYPKEAVGRDRKDDRFDNRDKRRSRSRSPVRRFKRKEDEAPAKRLDDLFKKTKVTPCIYWLPLTPEQIAVKEEMRRQHMAEHERRKEEIRKQEREREKERQSRRDNRRNSSSRDRNRRNSSRSRDRNNH